MMGNSNFEERGTGRDETGDDRVLRALSKPVRRRTLRYLDTAAGEVTLSELAAHLADDPAGRERAEVALHHVHLPKLADCGLVEYDPEDHRATGSVPAAVEPLLNAAD